MTTQLARRAGTQLRDDHIETNPVTTSAERFVLLTSPHGWTANQVDQMMSGLGGTAGQALMSAGNWATLASGETDPLGGSTALLGSATGAAYAELRYGNTVFGFRNWPGAVIGDKCSFFCAVKAGTSNFVAINPQWLGSGDSFSYIFNLTTGARVAGLSDGKVKSVSLGNGWWGFFGVGLTMANTSGSLFCYISNGTAGQGYTPPAGTTLRFWWGTTFHLSPSGTLPFTGGTVGLDNAGDGKFPFFNPISEGGEIVSIPLPASVQTPAALTVYMEWLDRANQLAATAPGVFRLGNQANSGNGINVTQTSTGFSGTYTNGASTSAATVTLATAFGDLVTLRATLDTSGALTLNASKNGATEVNGSAGSAAGLAMSWSDNLIMPNCLGVGTTNTQGDMALRKLRVYPGVQTLTTCQS